VLPDFMAKAIMLPRESLIAAHPAGESSLGTTMCRHV
jgi:hypothetical protein